MVGVSARDGDGAHGAAENPADDDALTLVNSEREMVPANVSLAEQRSFGITCQELGNQRSDGIVGLGRIDRDAEDPAPA